MKRIARVTHFAAIGWLVGVFACGSVRLNNDAGSGTDGPTGDAAGPMGDAGGTMGDAAGLTCDFASVGNSCVFPPHVSLEPMRTCFAATSRPALKPPVG